MRLHPVIFHFRIWPSLRKMWIFILFHSFFHLSFKFSGFAQELLGNREKGGAHFQRDSLTSRIGRIHCSRTIHLEKIQTSQRKQRIVISKNVPGALSFLFFLSFLAIFICEWLGLSTEVCRVSQFRGIYVLICNQHLGTPGLSSFYCSLIETGLRGDVCPA